MTVPEDAKSRLAVNDFALVLRTFRLRISPELSLRKLAKRISSEGGRVSSTYLAALEAGRQTNPSVELIGQIAAALQLTATEHDALVNAARSTSLPLGQGIDVDVEMLLGRTLPDTVRQIWIGAVRPLQFKSHTIEQWCDIVLRNIERGISYRFFMHSRESWHNQLLPVLSKYGELSRRAMFIEVTVPILIPFLLRPPWVIFAGQNGPVGGIWAKLSANGTIVESVYQMDSGSLIHISHKVQEIISALQGREQYVVGGPLTLQRIYPPSSEMKSND